MKFTEIDLSVNCMSLLQLLTIIAVVAGSRRCRYPKIVHSARAGNGRETPQQRASATASKKVRMAAWDDLLALEANERIPPPWHMRYRSAWPEGSLEVATDTSILTAPHCVQSSSSQ